CVRPPHHRQAPAQRHYTPLHFATLKGHTGICRLLLGNVVIPDPRTLQGWTPMHLAALKGHTATLVELEAHQGSEDVVSKLLVAKADPNVAEDSGWTALHLACNGGLFPSVLQLISNRANVNAQNNSQATPLHLAAQNGSVLTIKGNTDVRHSDSRVHHCWEEWIDSLY
uniref:Ankyrin repeat and kinase domain containing 1 n=1 Tax=Hucho hucho TaxID=62062 RepID=A0A4W5QL58_9TELE